MSTPILRWRLTDEQPRDPDVVRLEVEWTTDDGVDAGVVVVEIGTDCVWHVSGADLDDLTRDELTADVARHYADNPCRPARYRWECSNDKDWAFERAKRVIRQLEDERDGVSSEAQVYELRAGGML